MGIVGRNICFKRIPAILHASSRCMARNVVLVGPRLFIGSEKILDADIALGVEKSMRFHGSDSMFSGYRSLV